MAMVVAVPMIVVSLIMGVSVPGTVRVYMIVFVGHIMMMLMSVILPVTMADTVGTDMIVCMMMPRVMAVMMLIIMGMAVTGTVGMNVMVFMNTLMIVGMAADGNFLSGLKIEDSRPRLGPASAMSAHQATSASSSMLLMFKFLALQSLELARAAGAGLKQRIRSKLQAACIVARAALDLPDLQHRALEHRPLSDGLEAKQDGIRHDTGQISDIQRHPAHPASLRGIADDGDNVAGNAELMHGGALNRFGAAVRRPACRRSAVRQTRYAW
jgi:hypothetical protein